MMQMVMRALVSKMDFDSECSRDVRLGAREGGFVSACVCVCLFIYIYTHLCCMVEVCTYLLTLKL